MCECFQREDGTWHVDECCAWVMEALHGGGVLVLPRDYPLPMRDPLEGGEQANGLGSQPPVVGDGSALSEPEPATPSNLIGWICPVCGKSDLADSTEQLAMPEHVSHRGVDIGTCKGVMVPVTGIGGEQVVTGSGGESGNLSDAKPEPAAPRCCRVCGTEHPAIGRTYDHPFQPEGGDDA